MKPGSTLKPFQPRAQPHRAATPRGAIIARRGGWRLRLANYFISHRQAALGSLGQVARSPLASLMTVGAIGVIVALPVIFYVILINGMEYAQRWSPQPQITVFLVSAADADTRDGLTRRLRSRADIDRVDQLTPEDALREYAAMGGDMSAVEALPENPFPHILRVWPKTPSSQAPDIGAITDAIGREPAVARFHADAQWVGRMYTLIGVGRQGLYFLAGLLAVAALLTVSNTIRLAVENRREEVALCRLLGASNRFIRRPFVYTGIWYGFLGGLLACATVETMYWGMGPALAQLAAQVGELSVRSLHWWEILSVVSATLGLGWIGARFAAGRQLRRIAIS